TASGEKCELTSGQPRPKENGKQRPISIPALEDKLVQKVMVEILSTIYEQDFLDCSYGFRPGRGAHYALDEVKRVICTRSRKRWKEAKGSLQLTPLNAL